jgi:hypothetical protein
MNPPQLCTHQMGETETLLVKVNSVEKAHLQQLAVRVHNMPVGVVGRLDRIELNGSNNHNIVKATAAQLLLRLWEQQPARDKQHILSMSRQHVTQHNFVKGHVWRAQTRQQTLLLALSISLQKPSQPCACHPRTV